MPKTSASPSSPGLIAQLGAVGGGVSGWPAVLWLVRLLLSMDIPASQNRPWAALCAVLGRIATGDFRLQGVQVSEWSVCRGSETTDYIRIVIEGHSSVLGDSDGFCMTVQMITVRNAEFLRARACEHLAAFEITIAPPLFLKLALTSASTHALFVTLA